MTVRARAGIGPWRSTEQQAEHRARLRHNDTPRFRGGGVVGQGTRTLQGPPIDRPPAARTRVEAIDVVRGIVMILMALDHVRDFVGDMRISPTDLRTASAALFFTRWVTHICAPTFFLLAGTGACLARRGRSLREQSRQLLLRGLWLIVLETVVLRCLAWQFNFDFKLTMLVVLWALGWAMIALSGLVYLPTPAVAAFGLAMIAGHNLFDGFRSAHPLWSVLHSPNVILQTPDHTVFVAYPLIPWIGVMAAGYALGAVWTWPRERRRRILTRAGSAMVIAFIVLRALDIYGDPIRRAAQSPAGRTALAFLNTTKYPPSLLFLLMTLGPALLLLAAFDRADGRIPRGLRPALVIGKVPLFYYMVHAALIHLVAIAICYGRYGEVHWMFESPNVASYPITRPPGWGLPLPGIYAIWIGVVVAMYPLCRWFAGVKQRRRDWWLQYV
jgi:uncharacterized membrane protein